MKAYKGKHVCLFHSCLFKYCKVDVNFEKLFSLLVNGEIRFFETNNFNVYVQHIAIENLTSFNMNSISNYIAVHITGKKVCSLSCNDSMMS